MKKTITRWSGIVIPSLTVLLFCLIIGESNAQDINLIKATSQKWAGGVCCRYGTYFKFIMQTKMDNITPDTVWVNGNFYPLKYSDDGQYGNTKKFDSLTHLTTYTIAVGETHDDAPHPFINDNNSKSDSSAIKNVPKKQFAGAALISYQYKKKQCTFIVKEFTILKSLAYP